MPNFKHIYFLKLFGEYNFLNNTKNNYIFNLQNIFIYKIAIIFIRIIKTYYIDQ